jgi:hypothetical protein
MYDATTTLIDHMVDQDYKEYRMDPHNAGDTRSE